jgi:hypothetical protein
MKPLRSHRPSSTRRLKLGRRRERGGVGGGAKPGAQTLAGGRRGGRKQRLGPRPTPGATGAQKNTAAVRRRRAKSRRENS